MNIQNDIIHDLDGSLSGKGVESYITPAQPHIKGAKNCEVVQNVNSMDTLVCNNQVQIRRVQFFSMAPASSLGTSGLKVAMIDPADNKNMSSLDSSKMSEQFFNPWVMNDIMPSWTVAVVTGHIYHVMFGSGIDFDNMGIVPRYNWKPTDKGVLFRMNNSRTRELYESRIYYGNKVVTSQESRRAEVGLSLETKAKPLTKGETT